MKEHTTIEYIVAAIVLAGGLYFFLKGKKNSKQQAREDKVPIAKNQTSPDQLELQMANLACEGVDLAEQLGTKLDGSKDSIKDLDGLLAKLNEDYKKGELTKQQVNHVATSLGAYVGTVFIKFEGGKWAMKNSPGSDSPMPTLIVGNQEDDGAAWPMLKVRKAILNGPEDAIWPYLHFLKKKKEEIK